MIQPTYYIVNPQQVGKGDIGTFLRNAISKQFAEKEYYITKEHLEEKITPYSNGKVRKLRGYSINESNTIGHLIYFDITDCPESGFNMLGR